MRKRLVVDALNYLDRLNQDAPSDRALRREMGVAYRVVGLVQRNGYRRAHLGDTAGAMRSYERSITALTQLVAEDDTDTDSAYELALALSARAAVEGEDGSLRSARAGLQRAVALFSAHLAHDTPDLLIRLELARTHLRLADVSSTNRDPVGRNTLGRYLDTLINSGGDLALAGAPEPGLQRMATVREPLLAATKRWHKQADIRAREIHFAATLGVALHATGRSALAMAQFDAAQLLATQIQAEFADPQPVLQTGAAVAGFYRARALVKSAEPGVAKAALTAAVAQLQALQERRALVPSNRFALIDEGRRLLLTLN